MREEEVTIASGAVRLSCTLTLPAVPPPVPVVLCLHGSGPLDRDENLGKRGLNVFNTIAADLAPRGIATLRFDKRGCGRSTGDYYRAGHTDLMADAAACLGFLESDARFGRRFVLGHSAGTLMGAELSLTHEVAGLVLLTPFFTGLERLLVSQAESIKAMLEERRGPGGAVTRLLMRIVGTPRESQRRLLDKLKQADAPVLRQGIQKLPARWLREVIAIDPAGIYARVRVPALVLGGGKDLQCDPADVGRIAKLMGDLATPVLIGDLTHLLRRDPGPASFASYGRLSRQPMDAEVVRLVGEWLAARV